MFYVFWPVILVCVYLLYDATFSNGSSSKIPPICALQWWLALTTRRQSYAIVFEHFVFQFKKRRKKNDILHHKSILPSMKVYMFESIIIRDGVKTQLPVDRRLHPVRPVSIILNNDNHLDLLVNRQLGFEVTGCFYE